MSRLLLLFLALVPFLGNVAGLRADEGPRPADLFPTLDANSDGTLSADEIGESQRSAFERLLRVGDADSDGRLTREEYLKAFEPEPAVGGNLPSRADAPARPQRAGGADRPDVRRLFEMADRDGDGKVALSDLPEPAQQRLRPLYERLGKDELTREDVERMARLAQSSPAGRGSDGGALAATRPVAAARRGRRAPRSRPRRRAAGDGGTHREPNRVPLRSTPRSG